MVWKVIATRDTSKTPALFYFGLCGQCRSVCVTSKQVKSRTIQKVLQRSSGSPTGKPQTRLWFSQPDSRSHATAQCIWLIYQSRRKGKLLSARTLRPSDVFTWLNSSFPVFLLGNQNAGLQTHAFPFSASCQEAPRSFQTSRSSTCTYACFNVRLFFTAHTENI